MDHYSHVEGILVETESEDDALPEEENALRRRRQNFYRRVGFQDLGYAANIYGVRYAMFLYGDKSEEEAMEAHQRLYHYELTPWLYDKFIHIPEESSDGQVRASRKEKR